jgi:hypothetical protein
MNLKNNMKREKFLERYNTEVIIKIFIGMLCCGQRVQTQIITKAVCSQNYEKP